MTNHYLFDSFGSLCLRYYIKFRLNTLLLGVFIKVTCVAHVELKISFLPVILTHFPKSKATSKV